MFSGLSKLILRIWGFKIKGWDPHQLDKYVVIAMPHTSNWDFLLGLSVRSAMKLHHIKYVGKSSLFRFPYGAIFRWLGGYPVDRSRSSNMVDSIVKVFEHEEKFGVTIAPEGTRGKVDKLKTGFYYSALGANVPIVMIRMDFGTKTVTWSPPLYPTGDIDADMHQIEDFYRGARGRNPENGFLYEN